MGTSEGLTSLIDPQDTFNVSGVNVLAINGGAAVVPPNAVAPWPNVTAEDKQAVLRAMDDSTPWRWPLPAVQELERAWQEFTGMRYAIACNSGTAALHMCVAACSIAPGDEVIVPADTFFSGASCVLQCNAVPRFVDSDPVTYNLDPSKIEEQITGRTRAVIAADLHGLPADYDRIREITERHGLVLIADASQAHGAEYYGRPVGSLADLNAASTNGCKPLSSQAEGALLTTNDKDMRDHAARVMMFGEEEGRSLGRDREYDHRIMGWNYRANFMAAAFTASQLARLPAMTAQRIVNGRHLTEQLAELPGIRPPFVPGYATHVYFLYAIMVEPDELDMGDVPVDEFRETFRQVMAAEGVVMTPWQRRPQPEQIVFQEQRGHGRGCPWTCGHAAPGITYAKGDWPVASDICSRRLVLGEHYSPMGPPNGKFLMDRIAAAFYKVLVDDVKELRILMTH